MPDSLRAVACDVIGTLFSLDSQKPLLAAAGLPPCALGEWFSASLRDLFALGAVGRTAPMAQVLEDNLLALLARHGLASSPARVDGVMGGMQRLSPQPGAADALGILRKAGLRTLALSNASRATTTALLERAGLDGLFDAVLSIEEVGLPKPCCEVYAAAARLLSVAPPELALVAAHPWDIQGARAAGLRTAFVEHSQGARFPSCFEPPDHQAADLPGIARRLAGG